MYGPKIRQAVDQCRKGKWREFSELDFAANGVSDEEILTWFGVGEGANQTWGVAALHAVLEEDAELNRHPSP